MVEEELRVEGRRLRFAVSDNDTTCGPEGPGSPPVWAVNIHGYLAGGSMYWRESARLAERFGWRVVNPSLPGFGGSDAMPWASTSLEAMAHQVSLILHHLDAGPAVILGHSMGGAVAVQYAHDHFNRTIGIIYRDGVATPAWKQRRGIVPALVSPFLPDVAPFADMGASVLIDVPDLLLGRMYSTARSMIPDFRRNVRTMGQSLPVGAMLMSVDLRPEVRQLSAQGMPLLAEWGCFDRISDSVCAAEFSEIARTPVQWVPGGHSWMLARPQGQADLLRHVASGQRFMGEVEARWSKLSAGQRALRAVN